MSAAPRMRSSAPSHACSLRNEPSTSRQQPLNPQRGPARSQTQPPPPRRTRFGRGSRSRVRRCDARPRTGSRSRCQESQPSVRRRVRGHASRPGPWATPRSWVEAGPRRFAGSSPIVVHATARPCHGRAGKILAHFRSSRGAVSNHTRRGGPAARRTTIADDPRPAWLPSAGRAPQRSRAPKVFWRHRER